MTPAEKQNTPFHQNCLLLWQLNNRPFSTFWTLTRTKPVPGTFPGSINHQDQDSSSSSSGALGFGRRRRQNWEEGETNLVWVITNTSANEDGSRPFAAVVLVGSDGQRRLFNRKQTVGSRKIISSAELLVHQSHLLFPPILVKICLPSSFFVCFCGCAFFFFWLLKQADIKEKPFDVTQSTVLALKPKSGRFLGSRSPSSSIIQMWSVGRSQVHLTTPTTDHAP